MLNIVIVALAICLSLTILAQAASAVDGHRLPARQPEVKTASATQPLRQGITATYHPTIMPTIPPPTPTRWVGFPVPSAGPAEPPAGPTFRHVPLPSVQEGPAKPARWPTKIPQPSWHP